LAIIKRLARVPVALFRFLHCIQAITLTRSNKKNSLPRTRKRHITLGITEYKALGVLLRIRHSEFFTKPDRARIELLSNALYETNLKELRESFNVRVDPSTCVLLAKVALRPAVLLRACCL
jgi:hypothetical protein